MKIIEIAQPISRANGETGELVSANASAAWMAPYDRAVAYLTDGTLFVRDLVKP